MNRRARGDSRLKDCSSIHARRLFDEVGSSSMRKARLVAEFVHYPDLRRMRLRVPELELRAAIDDESMIDQELVFLSNVESLDEALSSRSSKSHTHDR